MISIDDSGYNHRYHAAWNVAVRQILEAQENFKLNLPENYPTFTWRRTNPFPPCLEHISFRFGSQLFFVRLHSSSIVLPGSIDGLLRIAKENNGHACLFPIEDINGKIMVGKSGWGLIDAVTFEVVNPNEENTSQDSKLTEWELYWLALDYVVGELEKNSIDIDGAIDDPKIRPSIWIRDAYGNPVWLYVKYGKCENPPEDWSQLLERYSLAKGYFINIKFASIYNLGTLNFDNPYPPLTRLGLFHAFPYGLKEAIEDIKRISSNTSAPEDDAELHRLKNNPSATESELIPKTNDRINKKFETESDFRTKAVMPELIEHTPPSKSEIILMQIKVIRNRLKKLFRSKA